MTERDKELHDRMKRIVFNASTAGIRGVVGIPNELDIIGYRPSIPSFNKDSLRELIFSMREHQNEQDENENKV